VETAARQVAQAGSILFQVFLGGKLVASLALLLPPLFLWVYWRLARDLVCRRSRLGPSLAFRLNLQDWRGYLLGHRRGCQTDDGR